MNSPQLLGMSVCVRQGGEGKISFFSFLRIPPPAFDAVGWCPKAAGGKKWWWEDGGERGGEILKSSVWHLPPSPLSLSLPPSLHLLLLLLEFFQY